MGTLEAPVREAAFCHSELGTEAFRAFMSYHLTLLNLFFLFMLYMSMQVHVHVNTHTCRDGGRPEGNPWCHPSVPFLSQAYLLETNPLTCGL